MIRSESKVIFDRLRRHPAADRVPDFLIMGMRVRGELGRICSVEARLTVEGLAVEGLSPCEQRLEFKSNRRRA